MTTPLSDAAGKAFTSPFGAVLELRPEQGEAIFVDGRSDPPSAGKKLPSGVKNADCVWRSNVETMRRVLSSARIIENAMINGRLTIAGDMSVMARIKMAGR